MGQTINANEKVFLKFRKVIDKFLSENTITPQTLRNWILRKEYPKKRSKYSKEFVKKIFTEFESGQGIEDIAESNKLSKNEVTYIVYVLKKTSPKYSKYHDKILSLNEKGKTVEQIAKKLGITYSVIRNTIIRKDIIKRIKEKRKLMDDGIILVNDGYTVIAAAKQLGVTYYHLSNHIHKYFQRDANGKLKRR